MISDMVTVAPRGGFGVMGSEVFEPVIVPRH
jgi:hypothetical protein